MLQPPAPAPRRSSSDSPESDILYRTLVDQLLDGVAHVRRVSLPGAPLDFEYLAVNAAYERITGLTGVVGQRLRDIVPRVPEAVAIYERVIATGTPEREERWSGRLQRWLEVAAYRPAEGELVIVVQDVTARRRSEDDIRVHESILSETGRIAKVGGWSFDPETGRGFMTDAVSQILDFPPRRDMRMEAAFNFCTPVSRLVLEHAIEAARTDGTPYDVELEVITAAGVRKWVRSIGHTTMQDGRVTRVYGSMQDISDRKRVERRLATQNAVSRILAECGTAAEAVPRLLEALSEADRWDGGLFFITDGADASVMPCAGVWARPDTVGTKLVDQVRGIQLRRDQGLIAEALACGCAVQRSISEMLEHDHYPFARMCWDAGYRSVLVCPVLATGQLLGVAAFLSLAEKADDEDLRHSCAAIGQQFALFLERRRAEDALSQSEIRHRMLVEHASDGIFHVGPDGRYQEVNARYAEMVGWPRETIVGTTLGRFLVPEHQPRVAGTLADLRARGYLVEEFRVQRPDGTKVEVEISGRILPDGSIMAIVRDITQRKLAEAEVERRLALEEQLSRLAAAAPGGMYTFRLRPDNIPYFPYASPQFEELTGFTPEQLATDGRLVFKPIPADEQQAMMASIAESQRNMTMWSFTFRYAHPRKGPRTLDCRSMPVRDADGSITWHGFVTDVTERGELEEQLRQAQKMEAIGQLASGVAHDFNNLLTVIQGNAAMLADGATPQQECANEILQASDRAAALTRQLLLFSRKQAMHAVDLDLNEVVENMTKLLRRIVGEDIALRADYSPRPAIVHADAGMLEQVLLNLAVNSRDAMPSGGRLTIATSIEDSSAGGDSGVVARLHFSDTGTGIAPDVLPRIFEPFFTTKDVGKGTGLGLATVYAIVRQHGASIDVHSELGAGTTFDITFPVVRLRPTAPRRESFAAAPRGDETILVVEDEPAVRVLVANLLKRSGYEVLVAESGQRALEVFATRPFDIDLLITDMVMPDGLTGRQLAERLIELRPDIKVIYTSGYSAEISEADNSLVPGENFLAKPYPPAELARTVRAALDKH